MIGISACFIRKSRSDLRDKFVLLVARAGLFTAKVSPLKISRVTVELQYL